MPIKENSNNFKIVMLVMGGNRSNNSGGSNSCDGSMVHGNNSCNGCVCSV